MTRAKLLDLFAGFALVAAIVAVDVLGRRYALDESTRTFLLGSLALMLWQVRGWFGQGSAPPPVGPLLVLGVMFVAGLFHCAAPRAFGPLTPPERSCLVRRAAADLQCIADHDTRAAIDACRDDVRARLDCTDGGAP